MDPGHGHLEVVKFLHELSDAGCSEKAMDKQRQMVTSLWSNSCMRIGRRAARGLQRARPGNMYLLDQGKKLCSGYCVYRAAANGHLEIVKFAMARLADGHLEVLQYLHQHYAKLSRDGFSSRERPFGMVKYLHEHQHCSTDAMDGAATHGHLDVVEFLHEHRTEGCTIDAMDGAASEGHFDVVKNLHYHRHEGCTTYTMDYA
ncbi:TPA: LOW QUALITY PROTEIN: hypothetical protein N0F65_010713 [Lagenidium giganteum]|uniref:Ankyrin repeat-containing domain n=1 Tax=Lagenidium giganteum TaxID=4803 RepID=A0AAV2ZA81_9STRA|nr:TPA: LOW QUALITY PROTEIN: hypothetical protein N0F65_010713 [Lagenidium giganteum]